MTRGGHRQRNLPRLLACITGFAILTQLLLPYISSLRYIIPDITGFYDFSGDTSNNSDDATRQPNNDNNKNISDSSPQTEATSRVKMSELRTVEEETPTAQILTRGTLNSLTKLDAGDVVECYALTRHAKLKSIFGPIGNSTSNIIVKKSALAFRYMPRAHDLDKEEFELTLEYGPQRTGLLMDKEAMPMVNNMEGEGKFVSWENEGKVYYDLKIDGSNYLTAHYIAPITGAVLSKILSLAVEYTALHPRFQPFEVFSHGKLIIKSSSSDDFVWDMFDQLSKMYVDIKPLLAPKRRKLRLYVDGVEKVSGVGVGMQAAQFLEKFYGCVDRIHTGTFFPSDAQISQNETESDTNESESTNGDNLNLISNSTEELDADISSDVDADFETHQDMINKTMDNILHELVTRSPTHSPTTIPSTVPTFFRDDSLPSSAPSSMPTSSPTMTPIDAVATAALLSGDGNLVLETLKPCMKELQQEQELETSLLENSTADNGNNTTNETHITPAYLFVDGSMYFKLNMTPPYWEAIAYPQEMPAPMALPAGKGDLFDWTLAMAIIAGFVFGMLVMLSRIGVIEENKVEFWKRNRKGEDGANLYGQGTPHPFGEDVIPLSMGGRGQQRRQLSGGRRVVGQIAANHSDTDDSNGNISVEMTPVPSPQNNVPLDRTQSDITNSRFMSAARPAKNPDLVDLPDLRFSSRVAMPVSAMASPGGNGAVDNATGGEMDWNGEDFGEAHSGGNRSRTSSRGAGEMT